MSLPGPFEPLGPLLRQHPLGEVDPLLSLRHLLVQCADLILQGGKPGSRLGISHLSPTLRRDPGDLDRAAAGEGDDRDEQCQ
jgi:hypothetical protein